MAKQDVTVELFYSGAWNSAPAYTRAPVSIERGRGDESTGPPPPSTMTCTLDNRDGTKNPRNPVSPLYGLAGRNTPIRVKVGGEVRFSGEVSSWKPRRTVDFDAATGRGDAWTEIEAAGVLRRLGQGDSPLRSPLTRAGIRGNTAAFGVSGAPVVYWPCEDESGATSAVDVMGNAPPLGTRGDVQFGQLSPIPASAALPKFADSTSRLTGTVPASAYRSAWVPTDGTVVSFTFGIGAEAANAPLIAALFEDDAGSTYSLTIALDGSSEDFDTKLKRWQTNNPSVSEVLDSTIHLLARSLNTYHTFNLVLDQVGADINWLYQIKSPYGVAVGGGTMLSLALGRIRRVQLDASATLDALSFGHVMIHDRSTVSLSAMFNNTLGHAGESADERLDRLCEEEGVTFALSGTPGEGESMGVQRIATLVDLLNDPAQVDQGMLFETRGALGLTYRTLRDLYNQPAALTLGYVDGQIGPSLDPEIDDLPVRNDVEVKRHGGSSARVFLAEGPLSIQPPPDGVGRYDESVTVNAELDTQLPGLAAWRLALGTVDETRYARVMVDLDAPDVTPAIIAAAAAVDIGDLIVITGLPADDSPDDARLIVRGYTETPGSHRRTIIYNCTPARPYDVGVWDDANAGRYDSSASTASASFVAGRDTSLSVAVVAGHKLWVTGSGSPQFPLDILVSGVRLRVTAISGSSSPQTFTVQAAPVNSIAGGSKTIASGSEVRAWRPARWAL